jgi:gluconate 2-dehydrogenase alpha chain
VIVDDRAAVCVVGLGAAGGTIAAGLAARGLHVVGLECGPERRPRKGSAPFGDDEIAHVVDGALMLREPEVLVLDGGPPRTGTWLARNTGVGGPYVWAGFAYRFHPSDFRVASEVGVAPGTSVADWPISYADLEPWYEAAETLARVAGTAGEHPFEAPRRHPFPHAPRPRLAGARLLADAAPALGWHPYHPPAAILGVPEGGRGACDGCGACTFYGCHRDAKFATGVTALAPGSGADLASLEIRAGATAVEVVCDAGGRPSAVRYLAADGEAHEQPAGAVVLALNAPYVARLLLLSRSPAHPAGLGNASGQVGRHVTFHTGAFAYGVYDEPIHADRGPAPQVAVDDCNESRPWAAGAPFRRGGVLHGGMPAAFTGGPLAFARALDVTIPLPEGVPRFGEALVRFAAHAYPRHQAVYVLGEDLPQASNRVALDPEVRDSLGLPALRIEYAPHPEDVAQHDALLDAAARWLAASGATTVVRAPSRIPGGIYAGHCHGTTRMGTDPATSVTDSYGLVHGTGNCFVAGAGPFVTAAGLNPALTILALALRAVEPIAEAATA